MDLNEIKEIIQKSGGKFIIVEEGKPEIVIMSFEDFKKDLLEKKSPNHEKSVKTEYIPSPEVIPSLPREKQIPKELEDYNPPSPAKVSEGNLSGQATNTPPPASSILEEKSKLPKELEDEPLKIEDLPF